MDTSFFATLGLSKTQIHVYTTLASAPSLSGADIAEQAKLSRQLIYKTLTELEGLGLVEKKPTPGVAQFSVTHPSALHTLIEKQQAHLDSARAQLTNAITTLTSTYNMTRGKPGVQFFEGEHGVFAVLEDSLTSTETIRSYVDIDAIEKYIHDINVIYSKKRDKRGVRKRGIVLDTPYARSVLSHYFSQTTESHLIAIDDAPSFGSIVQIYDNKVSHITFQNDILIGIIIHDASIYTIHKHLFDFVWNRTEPITPHH